MEISITNFRKENFMPFNRNFTYWIDKRKWKYVFLLLSLELNKEVLRFDDAC